MRRRSLIELLLVIATLLAVVAAFYYRGAYRTNDGRLRALLILENSRCNATRSTLETIQQAERDGRTDLARSLYATVTRDLPLCARSRDELTRADGDIAKLLQVIPERAPDDPDLADRLTGD